MPSVNWEGIFPAVLTMFDARGRLDEEATREHIRMLVDQGVHGIVIGGTSGEFATLDAGERVRLIRLAVETVSGRVPVIAGTGAVGTDETIRLTDVAASSGADGAIVILPYYVRPTEQEVFEHFVDIGRASRIPIMVYNNPANSAAPGLDAARIAALYRDGLASAVKSTFPTVHQVHELRHETDDGFRVFYGSFMAPLEGLAGGAHGWISGILNVVAPDAIRLWQCMRDNDLAGARRAWARILPVRQLYTRSMLGQCSDLAIYRGILRSRGYPGGYCRRPLLDLSKHQLSQLRDILGEPQPAALPGS